MAGTCDTTNIDGTPQRTEATRTASPRVPLGQISPNVSRKHAKHAAALSGSPLKRSCTAALDVDNGFMYLKRRRLSSSMAPQSSIEPTDNKGLERDDANATSFRLVSAEEADDLPPLVSSQAANDSQQFAQDQNRDRSSSSERHSFSSLINYDPSSQAGHLAGNIMQTSDSSTRDPLLAPLILRTTSRAEALRLRLRVAMYKVQTDQVHVPFDYLREQTAQGMRESSRAVREAVAQLRDEARNRLATQQAASGLLPVLNDDEDAEEAALPTLTHRAPSQLGHGGDKMDQLMRTPRSRLSRMVAAELTSSAIRSNVAEGLLGLKNAQ